MTNDLLIACTGCGSTHLPPPPTTFAAGQRVRVAIADPAKWSQPETYDGRTGTVECVKGSAEWDHATRRGYIAPLVRVVFDTPVRRHPNTISTGHHFDPADLRPDDSCIGPYPDTDPSEPCGSVGVCPAHVHHTTPTGA